MDWLPDLRLVAVAWLAVLSLVILITGGSRRALAGLLLLIFSYGAMNLWTLVEVPAAGDGMEAHVDALKWAYDLWAFGLDLALVAYLAAACWFLIVPTSRRDLCASLVWIIVLASEVYHLIFEVFACSIANRGLPGSELFKVWGREVSIYACAREFGELAVWAPSLLPCLFLTWVVVRSTAWNSPRKTNGNM